MQTAKQYREALTDQIKAIAKDLDEMAEGLVGDLDLISDFEIKLKFGYNIVPTIVVIREHIGRNASSYFVERSTYER